MYDGGKFAPADSNPCKHGAEPVSLQRPCAKTKKVLEKRLAMSKLAERASKATGIRRAGALKAPQGFMTQREESMKPVKAFGDRCRFLPSIPATADAPLHSIGWTNVLVEMESRAGFSCASTC